MSTRLPDTFHDFWHLAERAYCNQEMVVSIEDNSRFFFKDTNMLVNATGNLFIQLGLKRGDRIILHSDNHFEYLIVVWAALRFGLLIVPIDYKAGEQRLSQICNQVTPSLIFCDRKSRFWRAGNEQTTIIFDSNDDEPKANHRWFSEWISKFLGFPFPEHVLPKPEDPAVILFTSGSSGQPKGVVLSQKALFCSGQLMATSYGWSPNDTLLSLGPMHTMSGFRNPAIAAVFAGATIVVAPDSARDNAPSVIQLCENYSVTLLSTVPAFLHNLLVTRKWWQQYSIHSLRKILVTGSSVDQKSIQQLSEILDARILSYYGLTETGGLCCMVPEEYKIQGDGCIGVPVGAKIRIIDSEGGPLEKSGVGELLVQSSQLMAGYWNDSDRTGQVLKDNYFHTGDLVALDQDGLLYLKGRRDNLIKTRSGERLSLEEIERCLVKNQRVRTAAAIPVTENSHQIKIVVYLTLINPELEQSEIITELRSLIRNQLGPEAVPNSILISTELPLSGNGKIDKQQLQRSYQSHED